MSFHLGEYATTEKLSVQIGAMLQNHHVVVLTDMDHSWTNWLMSRPGDDSCPSFDAGLYEVTVLSEVFVFFLACILHMWRSHVQVEMAQF